MDPPTGIEDLSVEMIHEIFKYVKPADLHYLAFMNSRTFLLCQEYKPSTQPDLKAPGYAFASSVSRIRDYLRSRLGKDTNFEDSDLDSLAKIANRACGSRFFSFEGIQYLLAEIVKASPEDYCGTGVSDIRLFQHAIKFDHVPMFKWISIDIERRNKIYNQELQIYMPVDPDNDTARNRLVISWYRQRIINSIIENDAIQVLNFLRIDPEFSVGWIEHFCMRAIKSDAVKVFLVYFDKFLEQRTQERLQRENLNDTDPKLAARIALIHMIVQLGAYHIYMSVIGNTRYKPNMSDVVFSGSVPLLQHFLRQGFLLPELKVRDKSLLNSKPKMADYLYSKHNFRYTLEDWRYYKGNNPGYVTFMIKYTEGCSDGFISEDFFESITGIPFDPNLVETIPKVDPNVQERKLHQMIQVVRPR